MARRSALLVAALLACAPALLRALTARRPPPRPCAVEGRGVPPRHWMGCAADPGPRRGLFGRERLLAGLPVPLDRASADDLAGVPGLSPRLAAEIVAERERGGPFARVDDLLRVRGIGPARLARARGHLAVEADPEAAGGAAQPR